MRSSGRRSGPSRGSSSSSAEWIAARVGAARAVEPAVAWAAGEIEARHGDVPIAARWGPKPGSRRRDGFRRALAMVERGPRSLADVALENGYYDQPHFNAEFRELAGLTPSELLFARYPSGVPIVPPERNA